MASQHPQVKTLASQYPKGKSLVSHYHQGHSTDDVLLADQNSMGNVMSLRPASRHYFPVSHFFFFFVPNLDGLTLTPPCQLFKHNLKRTGTRDRGHVGIQTLHGLHKSPRHQQ